MKRIDHPPKSTRKRGRRLPKRFLALLLSFAILFGTSGMLASADMEVSILSIESEWVRKELLRVPSFENIFSQASAIEELGAEVEPEAETELDAEVDPDTDAKPDAEADPDAKAEPDTVAAAPQSVVIEIDDANPVANLSQYDIDYDGWLLYALAFSDWNNLDAGEARLFTAIPIWMNTDGSFPRFDWGIPGFEGLQWSSSDESVLKFQPVHGLDEMTSWSLLWLVTAREGTASVRMTLPNGIVVTKEITVLPRPAAYTLPDNITITPVSAQVAAGGTVDLAIRSLALELNCVAYVEWISDNPAVATVEALSPEALLANMALANGQCPVRIKGVSPGKAVITLAVAAAARPLEAIDDDGIGGYVSFVVEVTEGGFAPIAPALTLWDRIVSAVDSLLSFFSGILGWVSNCGGDSIKLNKTSLNLTVGSTETLTATVTTNSSNTNVNWTVTSGSSYASVDRHGKVAGNAAGTAIVRATMAADTSKYEECTVTVTAATSNAVSTPSPDASAAAARNKTSGTNSNIFQWPLTRAFWVTDYYGCTRSCHQSGHNGTDIGIGESGESTIDNMPVLAMADGVIDQVYTWQGTEAGTDARGNFVVIKHTINGNDYWTLYQHMKSRNSATDVMPGDVGKTIRKGQQVGRVGNTGKGGIHLHFEIGTGTTIHSSRQNPMNYFNQV